MASKEESATRICSYCNKEKASEYIKTRRGTTFYICRNCLPGNMKSK